MNTGWSAPLNTTRNVEIQFRAWVGFIHIGTSSDRIRVGLMLPVECFSSFGPPVERVGVFATVKGIWRVSGPKTKRKWSVNSRTLSGMVLCKYKRFNDNESTRCHHKHIILSPNMDIRWIKQEREWGGGTPCLICADC